MLIRARVIHLRLVPKIFVVWQLGGEQDYWTVQITILRSNDWNALLPEVPPAGEEPPPPDGNPHPQFSPDLTAEQLYQQQVHNWLVQNAAPPNGAPVEQDEDPVNANAGWGGMASTSCAALAAVLDELPSMACCSGSDIPGWPCP